MKRISSAHGKLAFASFRNIKGARPGQVLYGPGRQLPSMKITSSSLSSGALRKSSYDLLA